MVISGSGSLPGGDYQEEITISGSGKVTGNTSCTNLSISGSGKVEGDLRCSGKAKISGSGSVGGNAEVEELSVSGSGHVGGSLKSKRCSVSGSFGVDSVMTEELSVSGAIRVNGDVSAENAVIHGAIDSRGLINAEKLEAHFDGDCRAESIGGSFIKIRRKGPVAGFWKKLLKGPNGECFQVNGGIEGDTIDLEYVIADSVTGRDVVIGPGCHINNLSYSNTVKISPEAEVGNVEKLDL